MSRSIRIRRSDQQHVAEIVIDRAAHRNAITAGMAGEFCAALTELELDDDVKVIVISGSGEHLCVGADADEIVDRFKQSEGEGGPRRLSQRARFSAANVWWGREGLFRRILHCPKITIVAARGYCFDAGLYLTLYADLTIASDTAIFANPQWRHIGVNGDVSMLIAAVGLKRAKELIYCGSKWNAATAMSYGLIDGVTSPAEHAAVIAGLAKSCAMIMRDAVAAEKHVVRASLARMQIDTGLAAAAVIGGWGTNIHFRAGEFNFLREARRSGTDAASSTGSDHFEG